MDYRNTLRVVIWYACFWIAMYTILPMLYNGMYHKISPSFFYRYITNNKYTEDIYIYKEVEPILKFRSDLCYNIDGFSEIFDESVANSNRYKAFIFLEEHIDEVLQIANANDKYIKYLEDGGTNIKGLEQFIHKRAHLDDKILGLAFYLTMLLVWCLFLLIVNNRKAFYVISIIVYIIVMASLYSDGLSDFLLLQILNSYEKFNVTKLTYQDMKYLQIYFLDALKESLMTVVIFDTLFQMNQGDKYEKTIKECRYIYQSLTEQIEYLQFSSNSDYTYIARLKVPFRYIKKKCYKEKGKLYKYLMHQKKHDYNYYKHKDKYNGYKLLYEKLYFVTTNREMSYTTAQYIQILREIKELMIVCEYNF